MQPRRRRDQRQGHEALRKTRWTLWHRRFRAGLDRRLPFVWFASAERRAGQPGARRRCGRTLSFAKLVLVGHRRYRFRFLRLRLRLHEHGNQFGGALTASLTPFLASRFGWTTSFLVAAGLSVFGAVAWLFVDPERGLSPEAHLSSSGEKS